jgi:hypothetical protein
MVQTGFVVINEYTGRDMHRVDQAETFSYSTLFQRFLDLWCNVYQLDSVLGVEPEFFLVATHYWSAFCIT